MRLSERPNVRIVIQKGPVILGFCMFVGRKRKSDDAEVLSGLFCDVGKVTGSRRGVVLSRRESVCIGSPRTYDD